MYSPELMAEKCLVKDYSEVKNPQERNSDRLNIGDSFVSPDNLWSVM